MCPVYSVNHVPGLYRMRTQPFRAGLSLAGGPPGLDGIQIRALEVV
jgi:hypothetical protein